MIFFFGSCFYAAYYGVGSIDVGTAIEAKNMNTNPDDGATSQAIQSPKIFGADRLDF